MTLHTILIILLVIGFIGLWTTRVGRQLFDVTIFIILLLLLAIGAGLTL